MSGWNIVYGLINFAILAAALYFIGRKIVSKGYRDHREKVEETLVRADESAKEAQSLLDAIPEAKAAGERACGEILGAARAAAGENSRLARERDAAEAARLAAENDRTLEHARADLHRAIGGETAGFWDRSASPRRGRRCARGRSTSSSPPTAPIRASWSALPSRGRRRSPSALPRRRTGRRRAASSALSPRLSKNNSGERSPPKERSLSTRR